MIWSTGSPVGMLRNEPRLVGSALVRNVHLVAAGYNHSVVVCEDQTGVQFTEKILKSMEIICIHRSEYYCRNPRIAVCWGGNWTGQLGLNDATDRWQPTFPILIHQQCCV